MPAKLERRAKTIVAVLALLDCTANPVLAQNAEFAEPIGSQARSSAQPRIIGGEDVGPGQGPWAASLGFQHIRGDGDSERFYCGGSFVSPRVREDDDGQLRVVEWRSNDVSPEWLITAAHCVVNDDGSFLEMDRLFVLGGTRNRAGRHGEVQQVLAILPHRDYSSETRENDIALLRLSAPQNDDIPSTQRVSIRLPDVGDTGWIDQNYLAVIAQGWGRTETGSDSLLLKEVTLPLVSRALCEQKFALHGETITQGMLCAGFVDGYFDSCQGDSGGPLIYRHQGNLSAPRSTTPVLLGVISWGIQCGKADLFGIYTRVSVYRSWAASEVVAHLSN